MEPQVAEQRREEHKHLQAGESVSKATPLPHAEDEDLLGQLLVEATGRIHEAFGPKHVWIAPKTSGDRDVKDVESVRANENSVQMRLKGYSYVLIMVDLVLVDEDTRVFGDEVSVQRDVCSRAANTYKTDSV